MQGATIALLLLFIASSSVNSLTVRKNRNGRNSIGDDEKKEEENAVLPGETIISDIIWISL